MIETDFILQSAGWAMIHSLWKGLIIFLILRLLFFVGEEYLSSRSKGLLLIAGVVTLLFWTLIPFVSAISDTPLTSQLNPAVIEEFTLALNSAVEPNSLEKGFVSKIGVLLNQASFYLPFVWIFGAVFYILRTITGIRGIKLLRKTSLDPDTELKLLADKVGRRLGLRHIEVKISDSVTSPVVIGFLKSTILFPVSWSMGLSPQQLECILAHESAHILRRDGLVNLFLSFIEPIIFFNPFYWTLKAQLQTEQEKACDEIALNYSGNRKKYAQTLLSVAQFDVQNDFSLSTSFFKMNKNELIKRIKFIMEGNMDKYSKNKQGSLILAMMLMIGMILIQVNDLASNDSQPVEEQSITATVIPVEHPVIHEKREIAEANMISLLGREKEMGDPIPKVIKMEAQVQAEPDSDPQFKVRKIKELPMISLRVLVQPDTIPDFELWEEEFSANMERLQEEMERLLEGNEDQLREMSTIMENFNEQWAERMAEMGRDMAIEFEALQDMEMNLQDIQTDLQEIEVRIHEEMLENMEHEMHAMEEHFEEMAERFAEDEERWKEEEMRWKEEEQKWKEEEFKFQQFESDLKEQLLKDKLIDSEDDPVKFKYDEEGIEINGKKLNKNQEKKYRELLNKHDMKGKRGTVSWN